MTFVFCQLICRENKFLQRLLLRRIVVLRVERVHDQRSINLDRVFRIGSVEEHTTAKAPHARQSLLMQHGVGPERHNSLRYLGKLFPVVTPGHLNFCQVESRATAHK